MQNTKTSKEWVFVPVKKVNLLKRTEDYVLFLIGENTTAIVSSKFVRQKESDDFIYISLPDDYSVSTRQTGLVNGKWQTIKELKITPYTLKKKENAYTKPVDVEDSDGDRPF